MFSGFEPVYDENSRVLILGSFPSVISREIGFYYGNPRNRFWRLIGEIFGEKIPDDTDGKKEFLLRRKIALWDAALSCEIKGSLDSDMRKIVPADLSPIFERAKIELVVLNGKKSYDVYRKNCRFAVKSLCLPSTSPANVNFDGQKWRDALEGFV